MDRTFLDQCVNCRACEMACSLHHTGAFGFEHASISIGRTGDGFGVWFKEPFTCDTCEGEGLGNYQCVKYCYRAKDSLKEFIEHQGEEAEAL